MIKNRFRTFLTVSISLLAAISVAHTQYSGGTGEPNDPYQTGEPNDPYQIAAASDLIALGETPDDYDKHFILTADIDLAPNLPGRRVFDRAVIAWDANDAEDRFQGTYFTGVFDGNDHTVSNLVIMGEKWLGLFGILGDGAIVSNLGLEAVDVNGTKRVGGLTGRNSGSLTGCSSSGTISGESVIGGLVGSNSGTLTSCHSIGSVTGTTESSCGGLVGWNGGPITSCYSSGVVTGQGDVGGLVGSNFLLGYVTMSYSMGSVCGGRRAGGLVGEAWGDITESYSTATVEGDGDVGGLVGFIEYVYGPGGGYITAAISDCYSTGAVTGNGRLGGLVGYAWSPTITASFWDIETSGQTDGWRGTGLTTGEMQTASTFLEAGWDFVGETENGPNDVWKIVEGQTYPLLSWQKYGGGAGEPNDPYLIYTAEHLNALGAEPNDYDKHFKLMADIDLSGHVYDRAVIAPDMNDVEHAFQGTVFNGVFDGNGHSILHLTISGGGGLGLFGKTGDAAIISNVGMEGVDVNATGNDVGGLVGDNDGTISNCYSSGAVSGQNHIGGLVGDNGGTISNCYSNGLASVHDQIEPGGLVGIGGGGMNSFWDIETSGQTTSAGGGTGLTTSEMQTASTFLDAGWDFVDETESGTEDIWWILEGQDYPRLWWEWVEEDAAETVEN